MEDINRGSFIFYNSFYQAIIALPETEQLPLYRAVCSYALTGKNETLNGAANGMFALIKPQIDANIKRRESGKKGGAPQGNSNAKKQGKNNQKQPTVEFNKTTQNNQKQPNVNVNVNVNDNVNVNNIPPLSPKGGERARFFEKFYSAYPKHQAKKEALKAFEKLNPDDELLDIMLSALEKQKQTEEWQRDNGRYIPLPATWLNGRRWEDEPMTGSAKDERPHIERTPEELARIEMLKNI